MSSSATSARISRCLLQSTGLLQHGAVRHDPVAPPQLSSDVTFILQSGLLQHGAVRHDDVQ
eukprot:1189012-Prorocentrum_minimum.AAC.1